jgi:AraC-like DNA-binding protein
LVPAKECAKKVRNTAEVMATLDTMSATQGFALNSGISDARPSNESGTWLEFVGECHAAIGRLEKGTVEQKVTSTLLAAAARLQTRTARVLALTMISRVAGRAVSTTPMSTPASVIQPPDRPPAPPPNPRVASVLEYVHEHHSRSSCRLEEVARTLRVSRSYLSRLVQRETGLTFNRHLQLARMNTAARLLQASSLSVKEISAATGYEHVPSFDRQFRKHFRMTPGEFRRGIRI